MTSEYAQFRQWQHICSALGRLAPHRPLDPVVLTEITNLPTDPDVEEKAPAGSSVSLLIVGAYYAYFFRALESGDWRIEIRVALADCVSYCVVEPFFLQAKFDADASHVALEILTLVE